jgi:tRNA(Arg) A34 adenosine deaminase TadA
MLDLLYQAAQIALPSIENDYRDFWLGCIGIREDGVMVSAKNGAASFQAAIKSYHLLPTSHAEGRVLRKLGGGGTVYVARVSKKDGSLVMARPCSMCQIKLRAAKVNKVYYTINNNEYGIWYPDSDTDKIIK